MNLPTSCIFIGSRSETAALMMQNRFSIRLVSGDCAGQPRSWTPCSFIQVLLALAVWHWVLFCWKIQCWACRRLKRAWAHGSMWCSKLWQWLAVKHLEPSCIPKPLCFLLYVSQLQQSKRVHFLPHVSFAQVGFSWKLDSSDHRIFAWHARVHWRFSSPTDFSLFFVSPLSMAFFLQYTNSNHVSKIAHEQFWLYTGPLTALTTVASVLELFSSCRFDTGEAEHDRPLLYCTWVIHS